MSDAGTSGPALDAALARRLIDGAPVIVLTLDRDARITWLGGAVERLSGYRPDELVGTNILDHIDATWNPAALESVAFAFTRHGLQRPMLFKVIRKDGSTFVAEATANAQLDDPAVDGVIGYLRRWDERYLLDMVVENLAAGAPLEATLALMVEVMGAETLEADSAVLYRPQGGRFASVVAGSGLDEPLAADDGSTTTPWHDACVTGEPVAVRVDDLPGPLRSAAETHGYRWCWAWPARGPRGSEACLVLWRTADEEPDFTCRLMLDNLVRITGMVLEREQDAADLRHAASHDVLTGLANRAGFFERLGEVVGDARSGPLVGVLYVDLDHFKPINDRLGHAAGDQVLEEVARRLGGAVRDGDLVARLGGDEFAVVCPGVPDLDVLQALAERLTTAVRSPITLDGGERVSVGASLGIALAPPGECTIDALLDAADGALYAAKRDARGRWQVADPIRPG